MLTSCMVQAGIDYSQLRDHLKEGEFEKADDDTRALLIQLAGPDAEKRGWVYFSEVSLLIYQPYHALQLLLCLSFQYAICCHTLLTHHTCPFTCLKALVTRCFLYLHKRIGQP